MIVAETACWDLPIFGMEIRRKSSQFFNDDIYLPFSLLLFPAYACHLLKRRLFPSSLQPLHPSFPGFPTG
jgi:hypothetical protein